MGAYAARDRYDYGARWITRDFVQGGNPNQKTVTIDADSDFAVQKIGCVYSLDGSGFDNDNMPVGTFQVLIFDSTTGRYWSNEFVELATTSGPGWLPFVLPTPKVMVAKSEITIRLRANVAPVLADEPQFTLVLNFIGTKLFRGR